MPSIDDDARWAAGLAERVVYFERHPEAEAARRLQRLAALGVDPRDHKYYHAAVYLDAGDGALAVHPRPGRYSRYLCFVEGFSVRRPPGVAPDGEAPWPMVEFAPDSDVVLQVWGASIHPRQEPRDVGHRPGFPYQGARWQEAVFGQVRYHPARGVDPPSLVYAAPPPAKRHELERANDALAAFLRAALPARPGPREHTKEEIREQFRQAREQILASPGHHPLDRAEFAAEMGVTVPAVDKKLSRISKSIMDARLGRI